MSDILQRQAEAVAKGMSHSLWAEVHGDKVAIHDPIGQRTFRQLNQAANKIVRLLRERGVKEGDSVALLCSNRAEFVEVLSACRRGGYRLTPVNWHLNADEVEYIINDCDAKALFADTRYPSGVSANAPKIVTIQVPKDKIRDVIGTGGKVIREIVEQTGAKIDIDDSGAVKISAADDKKIEAAIERIKGIVAEPEVGVIYTGKVVKTADFGAFVNFLGAKDGLVHISELAQGRVAKTTDVVKQGDAVKVKVIGFDDRGKVKLSMRVVDQETGEDISEQVGAKGKKDAAE